MCKQDADSFARNAAANHAFLPRNGIATIAQTTQGLGDAFGMAPDLAIFLSVLSIAISGDPVTGTWSIGGGYDGTVPLLGRPVGIAGTHNQYESDASIVRGDAYLNNVGIALVVFVVTMLTCCACRETLVSSRCAAGRTFTTWLRSTPLPTLLLSPTTTLAGRS